MSRLGIANGAIVLCMLIIQSWAVNHLLELPLKQKDMNVILIPTEAK